MKINILLKTTTILFIVICFLKQLPLEAQRSLLIDYEYVLVEIQEKLSKGNKIAIRDLALLLEKSSVRRDALKTLEQFTAFTPKEFSITAYTTKEEVLDFFYTNQKNIVFSELLNVFYITPIEDRSVIYGIENIENEAQTDKTSRLKQHIIRFQEDMKSSTLESAKTQLIRIGELKIKEGYLFLLNLAEKQVFKKRSAEVSLYQTICQQIIAYKSPITIQTIIQLAEDKLIPYDFAIQKLAELTNINVKHPQPFTEYRYLLDSLGSVEAMRESGYNQYFTIRPFFYEDLVDYYGKIFILADTLNWIEKNALNDLIETRHPRVLYYLAIKAYRNSRNFKGSELSPTQLYNTLQNLVGTNVKIHNWKLDFVSQPDWFNDPKAVSNFLFYWAGRYNDYEWDKNREKFINKNTSSTIEQRLKLYIRRLPSTNDSVAWDAYLRLIEAEPSILIPIIENYRPVLRNHNPNLPPIEFYYLEQLSKLVYFCKRNDIDYLASNNLAPLLKKLSKEKDPKIRFQLEKEVFNNLQINQITSVEYWALLNTTNKDISFSAAWILNKAYAKFWSEIITNEKQLRLFLKKSLIFDRIGEGGICKAYLNNLKKGNEIVGIKNILDKLLILETDDDIIRQIEVLMSSAEAGKKYTWKNILEENISLNLIPKPSPQDYPEIYKVIMSTQNERTRLNLLIYVGLYAEVIQVPYLMRLLKDASIEIEREVLIILEKIYAYNFREQGANPKEQWLNFWAADSTQYQNWGTAFINIMLNKIRFSKSLNIKDINDITTSPFYKPEYRKICLEAISKVRPSFIRRLTIEPQLAISSDLRYLEIIGNLKYRDIVSIIELFRIDDIKLTIDFIQQKSSNFSTLDKGALYVQLFELEWFEKHILSQEVNKAFLNQVKKSINDYIDLSKNAQELERATVILALLENINKNTEEQLRYSIAMDATNSVKAEIQKWILKNISYAQIPSVLRIYNQLSAKLDYNFLHQDFGLPIFDLSDPIARAEIITYHKEMSQYDFYRHYLKKFGVDFEDDREKLDFEKVANILRHDLVPLFSGKHTLRNYHVAGVIRILELHFGTRFIFSEKFDSRLEERARYWLKYMEQRGIIKEKSNESNALTLIK